MAEPLEDSSSRSLRYQPLVLAAAALASGIVIERYSDFPLTCWIVAGIALLGLWIPLHVARKDRAAGICLLFSMVLAGGSWYQLRWDYFPVDDISGLASEEFSPCVVEGIAREAPRLVAAPPFDPMNAIPRRERTRLELDVTRVRSGKRWLAVRGRTLLTVDGILSGVEPGDALRVIGALGRPSPPLNPGTFNYQDYLRERRILATVFADDPAAVTILTRGEAFSPRRWLGRVRAYGEDDLRVRLTPDGSRLAAALLLNAREQLQTARTDAFLETGTIHHLAISGTHVGILAAALFLVLRLGLLPRGWALLLISLVVIAYCMVTGGEAPVLRATVLVLIVCLALQLGRQPLGFNSLGAAAICVLIWNPADLFDVGAQLSFLSVAVLIHVARHWIDRGPSDPLERLIAETRPWPLRAARWLARALWRMTLISLAVWAVTMPLIMARFHLVSPISVALNPLLWLPVAVALLSGFALVVLGWVPQIGAIAGPLCERSLSFTEWCVGRLNEAPGGHFYVTGPSDLWLVGFYAICGAIALFPDAIGWSRRIALVSAWACVGFAPTLMEVRGERPLTCHFLSVGHGSAVLIQLPDGRNVLYDAGQLGLPSAAARTIADTLWWHGITHLDALIISHADVDHYCAVPHLLKRFSVAKVYVSPTMFARQDDAVRALDRALTDFGVPRQVIDYQHQCQLEGDVKVEVLHPSPQGIEGSDNANSVVLSLTYQGKRLLLTGDLEPPGLEHVMRELPLDCDVLMAPHHGSGGSDPPGLIEWCNPEHVVISGGRRDISSRVQAAYAARGAKVYHTALDAAVTVVIQNGDITVQAFRAVAK